MLVKKYHDTHCEDDVVLVTIKKAIDASLELRGKKQLIEALSPESMTWMTLLVYVTILSLNNVKKILKANSKRKDKAGGNSHFLRKLIA